MAFLESEDECQGIVVLIGTTQVNVLFGFDYFLFRHRGNRQLHTGYGFALKCEEESSPVNSAAELEVAAVGTAF